MPRPKTLPEGGGLVHVTLPAETIGGLDEWVEELRATVPGGGGISRSSLIRDVLQKAVAEWRGEHRPTAARRRGTPAPSPVEASIVPSPRPTPKAAPGCNCGKKDCAVCEEGLRVAAERIRQRKEDAAKR